MTHSNPDPPTRDRRQSAPRRLAVSWFCVILISAGAASVGAHTLGQSYLYLQVYETSVSGRFEIALTDLNPALGLEGTEGERILHDLWSLAG